ncbi:FH3, partial [Symbiodinium sp. CCMP2456]
VRPQYQQPEHDTVFGDAEAACELDTDALASLLNGASARNRFQCAATNMTVRTCFAMLVGLGYQHCAEDTTLTPQEK